MNLVAKLLLVTCAFAITAHAASTDQKQDPDFEEPCETSEQCLAVNKNTECDPNKKKCFCVEGYGIDTNDADCKKYPLLKEKSNMFGTVMSLDCSVLTPSPLSQIRWSRNGEDLCAANNSLTWCIDTHPREDIFYSTGLKVEYFIKNDTYTCQAITSDGKEWTASETQVVVAPRQEVTKYVRSGDNYDVVCDVRTDNLRISLVRNDGESCTPDAKWCKENSRKMFLPSQHNFQVLNLQANQTFTCEVYSGDERLAIESIHHIVIGTKATINTWAIQPAGPEIRRGDSIWALFQIKSNSGKPKLSWKINDLQSDLKENYLTEKGAGYYECTVSYGPVNHTFSLSLEATNIYGSDTHTLNYTVGVNYGELCDPRDLCEKNSECDEKTSLCSCNQKGFIWDKLQSTCINGAMGVFAVGKEKLVMFALAILLTLFRSTTLTSC